VTAASVRADFDNDGFDDYEHEDPDRYHNEDGDLEELARRSTRAAACRSAR
jgi:hypothetical protein